METLISILKSVPVLVTWYIPEQGIGGVTFFDSTCDLRRAVKMARDVDNRGEVYLYGEMVAAFDYTVTPVIARGACGVA